MTAKLLPTTVVGSYPQPDWLVDRTLLSKGVARVRLDLWRVAEPWLEQAQDDATLLAIRDMERAGIDIITDGEMRRESYSNRFATSLEGIASGRPGEVMSKTGVATAVPRVVGPIRRTQAVETRDMAFLRGNTERMAKITLPGPFTMSRQAVNEYYKDDDEMVMDYATAVNAEARDLEAAGADVIQHVWLQQPGDALAGQRRAVHHRGTAGPQGAGDLNIDRAVRTHEAPVIAARSRFVNDTTMRSEIRWPLRRAVLLQIGRSGYQGAAERGNRTGHG